ncbi:MAG: S41 family peptidase [Candidatus Limnocylindria bacterium]
MTDSDLPATAPPPTPPAPPALPAPAFRRGALPIAWLMALVLAALLGTLLFLGGYLAAGSGGAACAAPNEAFASFCDAYQRLKDQYVDELSDEALAEGAIRGMFQYGVEDPYSGYMAPQEYQRALGDLSGKFSGIGAEMAIENLEDPADLAACGEFSDTCAFVVVAPLADSPAEAAGLLAGDIVTAVDGEPVAGSTMADQIGTIRGEAGTDVTLSIFRRSEDRRFDITITRAEITLQEVETSLIGDASDVGYIGLHGFSDAASRQFRDGLAALLEDGATQIIFDLRDNPGGYIEAAQQVASQFIADGVIFSQESSGDDERTWEATGDGVATKADIPVVVLVNGGSASASEIVAAALQERERATVIGEPTFGKNTVQVWSRLPNDGGVRITISRWFTPEHNSVAPDGVQPDIVAAPTPDTPATTDVILERALAFLAEGGVSADAGAPAGPPAASVSPSALPEAARVVGIVWAYRVC